MSLSSRALELVRDVREQLTHRLQFVDLSTVGEILGLPADVCGDLVDVVQAEASIVETSRRRGEAPHFTRVFRRNCALEAHMIRGEHVRLTVLAIVVPQPSKDWSS